MAFQFLPIVQVCEQKLLSWASIGLLIFISAFLWAPSRDGLQGVYVLTFFLPILVILFSRKPRFHEYGGWMTVSALLYGGFSVISSLWGEPKDFGFFALQWLVLATWLCGSCFIFTQREMDLQKYLSWFVILGSLIVATMVLHYTYKVFIFGFDFANNRLSGWNAFRNPNEIGAMCGIILLLAICIAFQSKNLKRVWFFYGLAFVAAIGVGMSFSRGALLACMITSFAALIIIRPALKIWLPPILIIAIAVTVILFTTNLHSHYLGERAEGIGGRQALWKVVIDQINQNIFTGIGMAENTRIAVANTESHHAHNAWLDILYRSGFIGLFLALLHLKTVMQKFSSDNRFLPLYLWLCYGCIWHLFDGGCFFREIGAKWLLYWIPAGLIAAEHTGVYIRTLKVQPKKRHTTNSQSLTTAK